MTSTLATSYLAGGAIAEYLGTTGDTERIKSDVGFADVVDALHAEMTATVAELLGLADVDERPVAFLDEVVANHCRRLRAAARCAPVAT